ncbi:MAG: glycoside hydrolase family 43 protein [Epulopiscium sp.]|nr:glycoside hydrolase family 43 protein [Candidatus Epulonipiscium sp.]
MSKRKYKNPIIPGFYPDPSICRVGEDYYLVTSTFSYFPGVPIFHSKDLVNWGQIGNVLDRNSQVNLDGGGHSAGIFAPTIRYHEGTFYMITTNVSGGGNFIVTAKDPKGPWSEPYFLEGAEGIDPSLFFDDDGRAYYVGTREKKEGAKYYGDNEVWLQELDLNTMKLVGQIHIIWEGALVNAAWPEAPHIYKKDGYYYIMIAEGGTGPDHAVTIGRSKKINDYYEGYPSNPILTHRHLGQEYPIVNVGHGDLIETSNGEWFMVVLASRPYGGYYRNLGRETFMVPLIWENGWPVINPGKGIIEEEHIAPTLPLHKLSKPSPCDNFEGKELDYKWLFIRNPREDFYSLEERHGYIRIKLRPQKLSELVNPSFIGLRQQHMDFVAETAMEFNPQNEKESAGIAIVQSNEFYLSMEYTKEEGQNILKLIRCQKGKEEVLAKSRVNAKRLYLKIEAWGQELRFSYRSVLDSNQSIILADNVDGRILSTDVAGGFVGNTIGMYCTSNNTPSENYADFDWFQYYEN